MPRLASPFIPAVIAGSLVAATGLSHPWSPVALAATDCVTEPKPQGAARGRWVFRTERATHRKCWYLEHAGGKARRSADRKARPAARPAQPPAPVRVATAGSEKDAGAISSAQECDQELSRKEVQRLTGAKTIVSVDKFPPYVTIVVDESAWRRFDDDSKRAIARNVRCAVAGPDSTMLWTVFLRNKDNQRLEEYSKL